MFEMLVFRVEVIKWPPLVFPVTLASDETGLSSEAATQQITQLLATRRKLKAEQANMAVAEAVQAVPLPVMAVKEEPLPKPKLLSPPASPKKRPFLQVCGHPPKPKQQRPKGAKRCLKAKHPPPLKGSVAGGSGAGLGLKIVFSIVCIL